MTDIYIHPTVAVPIEANRELQARVAEFEACLDAAEKSNHISDTGNMWRFWSDKAQAMASKSVAMHRRAMKAEARVAELEGAAQALGAMPEGYCFCSANRIGDDSKTHEPECADLRAALNGECK